MKYLLLALALTLSVTGCAVSPETAEKQRDKRQNCVKDTMPGSKVPVYRCY